MRWRNANDAVGTSVESKLSMASTATMTLATGLSEGRAEEESEMGGGRGAECWCCKTR